MRLSIVSTLYRSSPFVAEFHRRVAAAASLLTDDWELVLVNDGSPDDSLDVALGIQREDPRVVIVDLSRNFGHHKALLTGLAHARGELIFLLDSDLEEDPELLATFQDRLAETEADVVYGVQARRKGGKFEQASGAAFYVLFNLLSDHALPHNILTVRLMRRRYVDSLLRYGETELFLGGIMHSIGYHQVAVPVRKHDKRSTTYSLARRIALLVTAVTSFSSKPLEYIFKLGLCITGVSIIYGSTVLWQYLHHGVGISGWTSVVLSVWMLGGLNFMFLGVLGIYVAKMFNETKHRPMVIVRQVHRLDSAARAVSQSPDPRFAAQALEQALPPRSTTAERP